MKCHRVELLTDWRTLAGALEDEGAGAERLSHAAVTNLLQLLTASVHKACGGTLVAARQDSRYGCRCRHRPASCWLAGTPAILTYFG